MSSAKFEETFEQKKDSGFDPPMKMAIAGSLGKRNPESTVEHPMSTVKSELVRQRRKIEAK